MVLRVGIVADSAHGQRTGIGNYVWRLLRSIEAEEPEDLTIREVLPATPAEGASSPLTIKSRIFTKSVYLWYPYVALRATSADVDVLHNPAQVPTFFRTQMRSVLTVHDIAPLLYPAQSKLGRPTVYRMLFGRTVRNAVRIITVSQNTKTDLIARLKVPSEKIVVIPLAVSEQFRPDGDPRADEVIRRRLGVVEPYVLYVGTLEIRKNIPTLIEAFDRVCSLGCPHTLVLTGKLGWKTRDVIQAIAISPYKHRIVMTGFVSDNDLPALYRGAHVFVYPSRYEGFGLPPLEAMASGTPVITSDASSLPEVVGDAGILVPPSDVTALARAISDVLNEPTARAAMRLAGLARAKMFDWTQCAKSTLDVYREVGGLVRAGVSPFKVR